MKYEKFKTKSDNAEEEKAIAKLMENIDTRYTITHNTIPNNVYDFDIFDENNNLVCIVEFKRRYIDHDKFTTWVMSKSKLDRVKEIAEQKKCKAMWLFGFNDGYFHANIKSLTEDDLGPVKMIVRDKKRTCGGIGVHDKEPGYYVRINSKWKKLK